MSYKTQNDIWTVIHEIREEQHAQAGIPSILPSITGRNTGILELVNILNGEGFEIDVEKSMQNTGYGNQELVNRCSLAVEPRLVEGNVYSYELNGAKIKIALEDYNETKGRERSGFFGHRIGGSVTRVGGVRCTISMRGSYEDVALLGKAVEMLDEFYAEFYTTEKKA